MDLDAMIAELRQERELVEEAILTLERLARTKQARRGRPPKWLEAIRSEQAAAPLAKKATKKKRAAVKKTAADN